MDIWVVSPLGYCKQCCYEHMRTSLCVSLGYKSRSGGHGGCGYLLSTMCWTLSLHFMYTESLNPCNHCWEGEIKIPMLQTWELGPRKVNQLAQGHKADYLLGPGVQLIARFSQLQFSTLPRGGSDTALLKYPSPAFQCLQDQVVPPYKEGVCALPN